jgi:hypothetical protein
MTRPNDDVSLEGMYWRGTYLVALLLGLVVPLGVIIVSAVLHDHKIWRFQYTDGYTTVGLREGPLLLVGLVWSAATLVAIVGVASAGWLASATAARLGIERTREYLGCMFVLAVASGAIVPLAAIIAAAFITAGVPAGVSSESMWLLTVVWFGMIAVSIAGLFCAAWLVRSVGAKLGTRARQGAMTDAYEPARTA